MEQTICHHQQGRIDFNTVNPSLSTGVSGNLSGVGDGFPNTSLVLVEHGYNPLEMQAHSFCHISANLVIMEGMLYYPIPQEKHTLTLVLNLMRHFSFHSLLALL